MAEQTKEQQVIMTDPKRVEQCKRLAEHNRRKREGLAQLAKAQSEPKLTYYSIVAIEH